MAENIAVGCYFTPAQYRALATIAARKSAATGRQVQAHHLIEDLVDRALTGRREPEKPAPAPKKAAKPRSAVDRDAIRRLHAEGFLDEAIAEHPGDDSMKLRIYGGLRGATEYGLDTEITVDQALQDGYRVWIDPEGWYVGDPTSRCRWSGWKAKPINEAAETPLDIRIEADATGYHDALTRAFATTAPAVLANPDCRDGKHDACNGDGWDTRLDAVCDCPCTCHEPKENDQ